MGVCIVGLKVLEPAAKIRDFTIKSFMLVLYQSLIFKYINSGEFINIDINKNINILIIILLPLIRSYN